MAVSTDHCSTYPTRKRPHTAVSEARGSERNQRRRQTKSSKELEDRISSLEKTVEDLQREIAELKKQIPAGKGSDRSITSTALRCNHCRRNFTRRQNLVKHIRTFHPSGTEPDKYCNICKRSFKRGSDFSRHMKIHGKSEQQSWHDYGAASPSSQAESEQFSVQSSEDSPGAMPRHSQPSVEQIQPFLQAYWDTFDAAPLNLEAEPAFQLLPQRTWNTFNVTPFDLEIQPTCQPMSQENWEIFSAAPFDFAAELTNQPLSREIWDTFNVAPFNP
ncbi:hypothetical protein K469DRAFT_702901 [Zopfia rhizophila CBS 207.26]|uniref:C2H2-type domain-containing protein n=1 Tax=Zopfia rhizophila CBS 207.26 TaxID=1314779 RepID=A0A6A6D825_9PEZI|nr:hypothetical protein K469DRAFT_702901 [Zopfia rhizophila CBS 207.26]